MMDTIDKMVKPLNLNFKKLKIAQMDRLTEMNKLTTFDLAFNLATGKYKTEEEKFAVLEIIKGRDATNVVTAALSPRKKVAPKKAPLKGSKAEKIQELINKGKTAREIFDYMNDKKNKLKWKKTYYPEIYRLIGTNE
jgi:hypothetical protein